MPHHIILGALRGVVRGPKESTNPEIYTAPRNLDIFPKPLGSFTQSKSAVEAPIQYTLTQLKSMFQRAYRDEDHIDSIFVSSATYCKQLDDTEHEFLLLEVRDEKIPEISNFLVLDRTVQSTSSRTFTAISTSVSSSSPAQDRLRVSCYGVKDLLIKQCSLGPYEELERLVFPLTPSRSLLLCELVILALETSSSRDTYNLVSAQCFWFASCVWECMQLLVPGALCTQVAAAKLRGKFGNFFRQNVDKAEVSDILYKAKAEIRQFQVELTRVKEAAGRNNLDAESEQIQNVKKENEELKKELEKLKRDLAGETFAHAANSRGNNLILESEYIRDIKNENEGLGVEPERLNRTAAGATSMRVTRWGIMMG